MYAFVYKNVHNIRYLESTKVHKQWGRNVTKSVCIYEIMKKYSYYNKLQALFLQSEKR